MPGKSQFGQDDWVIDHFDKKRGLVYVESGVNDGDEGSNTARLDTEFDWKGFCIDPRQNNMEGRTCTQLHVALGSENKEVEFLVNDALSGVKGIVDNHGKNVHHAQMQGKESIKVKMRRTDELFKEANVPRVIDYMSLDVEGSEVEVLKSFPFDKHCVSFATIETNRDSGASTAIRGIMESHGYEFVKEEGVDHVYQKDCTVVNTARGAR